MKEITPEIKKKIMALYWDQEVVKYDCDILKMKREVSAMSMGFPDSYLELTPLSQITDEDAIEVAKIIKAEEDHKHNAVIGRLVLKDLKRTMQTGDKYLYLFDFLRSRGYALPAFGYSVEYLVAANIFKLKQ